MASGTLLTPGQQVYQFLSSEAAFLQKIANASQTEGYYLKFSSGNPIWATGGGGTWGSITGTLSNQTDLQNSLNAKAASSHTHVIADTTSLQTTLDGKASSSHTHLLADITDKGALASKNTVATADIDNAAVTYAKIQNISATDKVLGRITVGAGSIEEIICTAAGRALIDDADATAQRTTLGLGAMATKANVAEGDLSFTDITTANATITVHGLLPKLSGNTSQFLRGDGQFAVVPGGSQAFPVGSVFIAVVSTNPNTLLGYGTWVAFGAGRVLIGLDSGDIDFDVVEKVGGAKTKAVSAHAGTAVADHAIHTHTYTDVVNHVHLQTAPTGQTGTQDSVTRDTSTTGSSNTALSTANPTGGVAVGTTAGPSATLTHVVTQPSNHSDLNVVQPYIVVYFWKRTA